MLPQNVIFRKVSIKRIKKDFKAENQNHAKRGHTYFSWLFQNSSVSKMCLFTFPQTFPQRLFDKNKLYLTPPDEYFKYFHRLQLL